MKENEIFESEQTANGFRVRALLQQGTLSVQVDEQELQMPFDSKPHQKVWLIRSRVVIVLPATRCRAQRLIEQHTDDFDPRLKALLDPVWELWSELTVRSPEAVPSPQSPTLN
jgi:hypothetical protein